MYILFAFLGLIASCLNTIFNKLACKNASSTLSAAIKSVFMVLFLALLTLCLNAFPSIPSILWKEWIFIGACGVLTVFNWIFYFAAMKRTSIEVFAPFNETGELSIGNILFLIFCFNIVTNNGKPLSIVFYSLSIAVLLGAMAIIILSKKLNEGNDRKYVFFGFISVTCFAVSNLMVKLYLTSVAVVIISLFQMIIVMIFSLASYAIKKEYKHQQKLRWQDYLLFFIAATFNALTIMFRYKALTYDDSNPALVTCIIALAFVLVTVINLIVKKEHDKKKLLINIVVVSLVSLGVLLNFFSTLA